MANKMCKHEAAVFVWKSAMRAMCVWLCPWMVCRQQMAQVSTALITALSEWDSAVRQPARLTSGRQGEKRCACDALDHSGGVGLPLSQSSLL